MEFDWCTDWRTCQYPYQHFWQYQHHFPILVSVSEQLQFNLCDENQNSTNFNKILFEFADLIQFMMIKQGEKANLYIWRAYQRMFDTLPKKYWKNSSSFSVHLLRLFVFVFILDRWENNRCLTIYTVFLEMNCEILKQNKVCRDTDMACTPICIQHLWPTCTHLTTDQVFQHVTFNLMPVCLFMFPQGQHVHMSTFSCWQDEEKTWVTPGPRWGDHNSIITCFRSFFFCLRSNGSATSHCDRTRRSWGHIGQGLTGLLACVSCDETWGVRSSLLSCGIIQLRAELHIFGGCRRSHITATRFTSEFLQ